MQDIWPPELSQKASSEQHKVCLDSTGSRSVVPEEEVVNSVWSCGREQKTTKAEGTEEASTTKSPLWVLNSIQWEEAQEMR